MDKLNIVKSGVVRVNDVPQIQPMLRGLGLEWAGKVQHDGGVGAGPDTADDSQQIRAGVIVRAGPDEHFLGFLPLLRVDTDRDIVHLLSALHLQDAVSIQFCAEDQIVLSVAVTKQGAEFTIRVQITLSIPHLALIVQQLALTAAEMQIAVIDVGFGADGIPIRQRKLLVLLWRSILRCKHGIILRPPVPIAFFMGDVFSAH